MPDNVSMQGLEFQITDNSTQAVQSLNALATSLKNLKSATSGGVSGVNAAAKQITALRTALSGLNSSQVSSLTNLATALTGLKSVSGVKLSSALPKNLTSLSAALSTLNGADWSVLSRLVENLRPLTELKKSDLSSYITPLQKIPAVMEQLEKTDLNKFSKQLQQLTTILQPFANEMQKVSNGFSAFPSRIQKVITSTERYNSVMQKTQRVGGMSTILGTGLRFGASFLIIRRIAGWISDAVTASNAYQENLNLFTVAMGEYAEEAYEYGQTVSDVLGIDFSEWIRNQGVFNTLLTGFGDTQERAALMSKNLTQLGYDLSSFFNISVEDAMQKLQSGISGELEPLRRLGFDLSQARLEAEALSLGIDKSVASMTQAEKAELRYYAIMTQVTTAQGDLARTIEAPANQLRILSAQFSMAGQAVGNIFIPALNAILPYAIAVMKVIRELANVIASFFGFEITEVDYSGVSENLGSAASGAGDLADDLDSAAGSAKALKSYVSGIDELNIMSPDTGSAGAGGVGADTAGGGFEFELPEYDFLGDAVSFRVDAIYDSLEPLIDFFKENGKDILDIVKDIGIAMLAWTIAKKFINTLKNVVTYFQSGSKELSGWDRVLRGLSGVILMSVGIQWSFDAGRDIGMGEANVMTYIQAVLGPIATGIGGSLLSSAIIPGTGPVGFAIGVGLGILFEVIGYLDGKEAVQIINDFTEEVTNGKTSITEYATAAATAFTELKTGADTIAAYGTQIDTQNTKIDQAKQNVDLYMAQWQATGVATKEDINAIIENLDLLLTASQEKLGLAADAISTTFVQAMKDASDETLNTYNGMLSMIYLLESNGNTTIAGWKTELANAEQELQNLDETSATYEQDSKALMDRIGDLTLKIAGLNDATDPTVASFEQLSTQISGLDFSAFTSEEGAAAASAALDELSTSASEAYSSVRDAYDTNIKSLDALFAYVDTESPSWKAIYQEALDLGLDPNTPISDTEAVKELIKNQLTAEYEAQIGTLDELFADSYGTIFGYLQDAVLEVTKSTGTGEMIAEYSADQWVTFFGLEGASADEAETAIYNGVKNLWDSAVDDVIDTLEDSDTWGPMFSALSDSVSSVEYTRALETSGTTMSGAIIDGISEGMTSVESLAKTDQAFQDVAGYLEEYGMNAIDAHSPSEMTKPMGRYLTEGIAVGMTDETSLLAIDTATTDLATAISDSIDTAFGFDTEESIPTAKATAFMTDFTNAITTNTASADTAMQTFLNKLLDRIQTFVNTSRTAFNDLLREYASAMNSVSVSGDGMVSYSVIPYITVPKMATGGFVDQGQLFIAREAGAEMVGNIGRRTAVANNDQIVESISAGVTVANDAVVAAIYALMDVVDTKDFSVNIGDDEIGASYDRYTARRGERVSRGAFANAY